MKNSKAGIFFIVINNEMLISSKILLLKKELEKRKIKDFSISVIDNGSIDRTHEVAERSGARVIRYHKRNQMSTIINNLKKRVEKEKVDTVLIIDGNTTIDALSIAELLDSFRKTEKRSGMGYISESVNGDIVDFNCLIFKKEVFREFSINTSRIETDQQLLSFGKTLGLAVENRKQLKNSGGEKKPLFRIPLKSANDLIRQYRKAYPLRFYGGLSGAFFIFSMIPAAIVITHFIRNSNLEYGSFLVTMLLGGLGLIFLSIGLVSNALNVLSEKVRGMM